jgi:hypothetical protein
MNSNFSKAKDIYFRGIAIPKSPNTKPTEDIDKDSKYANAVRLGLCFRCQREDENPHHRPKSAIFAFCPECMEAMTIGTERLVLRTQNEVNRWFKD